MEKNVNKKNNQSLEKTIWAVDDKLWMSNRTLIERLRRIWDLKFEKSQKLYQNLGRII